MVMVGDDTDADDDDDFLDAAIAILSAFLAQLLFVHSVL